MKQKSLLQCLFLLFALIVGSTSVWAEDVITWEKVTDYSSLSTSDTYVIAGNVAGGTTWYSLRNNQVSSKSNLPYKSVLTIEDNKITSTVSDDETWTIEATATAGVYYIKSTAGSYYLQNDGSTGSKIDSKSTTDANNSWKIHFADSYTDKSKNTYTVTGLYLVKGDGRELAVYQGSSGGSTTFDFRCYAPGNYKNIDKCEIVFYKKVITSSFNITPVANNDGYGDVDITGTTITATPAEGYRVKSGDAGYTVTEGTASVTNNGNNTFTVVPSTDCTVQINFEAIPIHTATFSVNGETSTQDFGEGSVITFPDDPDDINGKKFVGWVAEAINGTTTDEPEFVTSATMPASDITYHAVFATPIEGAPVETLTQTLTYDTWTYSGATSNKSSFRLFGNGAYVESASFDLSKLSKVKIFGGTYGGADTYKTVTIGDGTNVWKNVEMTGTNNAKEHSFTDGTDLTGTKPLRVISTCGNGSDSGIRMSKIEIYTLVPTFTYTDYCTTATVTVTIGTSGFASYCSACALDFTDSNVNAYAAEVSGTNVVLTKVDKVPANEGVVLYCGTSGNYDIPVIATADDVENNEMVGVTERTQINWNVDGKYNYILQSGQFNKANGGYLKANRAYLSTTYEVAEGKELSIIFNDDIEDENETNGIRSIKGDETSSLRYNLAGQKVSKDYKGIVIINGKKMLNK